MFYKSEPFLLFCYLRYQTVGDPIQLEFNEHSDMGHSIDLKPESCQDCWMSLRLSFESTKIYARLATNGEKASERVENIECEQMQADLLATFPSLGKRKRAGGASQSRRRTKSSLPLAFQVEKNTTVKDMKVKV